MARKVKVVQHNPEWVEKYKQEEYKLLITLRSEVVAIHHIGSTAIPRIWAKPIIDILVEVYEIGKLDFYYPMMMAMGYQPRGEYGIQGRQYFVKWDNGIHTHHVHAFQMGRPEIARLLNFRDYLIEHSEEAEAYSKLKQLLAQQFPLDTEGYTEAKSGFVQGIGAKALRENP
ncbi:MAG TPA: GrpB family protein [Anaerolineales bacterium]|nr:GrpB family protein [Anaerolineales bacterium]